MNLRPLKTETEDQFVARVEAPVRNAMGEGQPGPAAMPNAIARAIWAHREKIWNSPEEFPKVASMRHLEPGLVFYEYLNEGQGAKILVTRPFMDRMRGSIQGRPMFNEVHRDLTPQQIADSFKNGLADGVLVRGYNKPEDGWDWADAIVWDPATVENIRARGYSVSCQYEVTDWVPGGVHNNIPYEREAVAGAYEHIAVVQKPRYEGARVFLMNSTQGGKRMAIRIWPFNKETKETAKNAVEIETEKAVVDVEGKEVPVDKLIADHIEAEKARNAKPAEVKKLSDDDMVMVDGKPVAVRDLKASHMAKVKNASEAEMEKAHKDGDHKEKALDNCPMCNKAKNEADEEERRKKDEAEKEEKAKNALADAEKARQKAEADELIRLANEGRDPLKMDLPATTQEKVAKGKELYGSTKVAA